MVLPPHSLGGSKPIMDPAQYHVASVEEEDMAKEVRQVEEH